jgi:glyoxylase-like metal-dependent hydrolase (beta-lactamase superfamily II)
MKKSALPVLLLLLVPAFCFSQPKPMDDGLWVFRYGISRLAEKAVFADGSRTRTVKIAWLFYALKRRGQWTLIDTGCDDREMIRYFNIEWTDPLVLLREAGIAPEDVSRVLLTHAHFDHIGLADRFPQARIIMSEAARQDAAAHAVPPSLRDFFRFSKRIDTFHGQLDVGDNIIMIEIGGHAAGSAVIRLEADKIIVTGDEAYLPENWTGPRPNGTVINARANADFLNVLHGEEARYLVLSLHDPALVPGKAKNFRLR